VGSDDDGARSERRLKKHLNGDEVVECVFFPHVGEIDSIREVQNVVALSIRHITSRKIYQY